MDRAAYYRSYISAGNLVSGVQTALREIAYISGVVIEIEVNRGFFSTDYYFFVSGTETNVTDFKERLTRAVESFENQIAYKRKIGS